MTRKRPRSLLTADPAEAELATTTFFGLLETYCPIAKAVPRSDVWLADRWLYCSEDNVCISASRMLCEQVRQVSLRLTLQKTLVSSLIFTGSRGNPSCGICAAMSRRQHKTNTLNLSLTQIDNLCLETSYDSQCKLIPVFAIRIWSRAAGVGRNG